MTNFTSLPFEVLHHIISYLLSNADIAALATQCRNLRLLCDMQRRKKYHQVRVRCDSYHLQVAFDILMDIVRRPSLGHYVRRIECRAKLPIHAGYVKLAPQRQLSDEDIQLLRVATRNAGFVDSQEDLVLNMLMQTSARRTDYGSFDLRAAKPDTTGTFVPQALAALLVSVSPNLQSMAMMPTGLYYDYHHRRDDKPPQFPLDQLLRRANEKSHTTPYLRSLREIYIINDPGRLLDDGRFYCEMDFLQCLTIVDNLPSIESVSTDLIEEDENKTTGLQYQSSNISRISIRHASVSSSYLTSIIFACRTLREFQFSIGGRSNSDGSHPIFSPETFIRGLLLHKETLEILDVDVESHIFRFQYITNDPETEHQIDRDEFQDRNDADERGAPACLWQQQGSLKDFQSLKRLSLGIGFLIYFAKGINPDSSSNTLLVDCLPPSLEYLCIRGYRKGAPSWDTQIDALMESIRQGASRLKEIEGVEELIPHAVDVENPDDDGHLLWKGDYGSTDDGPTDDGSTDDGSTDDESTDDESTDDSEDYQSDPE
ncbi:hypothetical protein BDW59DRAFT_180599 [Aspergillus cavernicola]|uniref:F-box domain-containing protein n=1 Tax=Aspergillus cavernicola TaxID=176166 RepID=A0ABR4I752_9EURO